MNLQGTTSALVEMCMTVIKQISSKLKKKKQRSLVESFTVARLSVVSLFQRQQLTPWPPAPAAGACVSENGLGQGVIELVFWEKPLKNDRETQDASGDGWQRGAARGSIVVFPACPPTRRCTALCPENRPFEADSLKVLSRFPRALWRGCRSPRSWGQPGTSGLSLECFY